MPSSTDRSPSSHANPSPGRRIWSRITSPLAQKSRSVTDFYIQPDEPHKQYSPGDIVTGSVRLRVVKPVRVTHIVVRLHGYVQVFKTPGSPGDGPRTASEHAGVGRGSKLGEYHGNGHASLFEDEVVLCGDGRLNEGSYQFNYEVEFPADRDLPSSIDFERGTVSYMVTATITRPTTISPTMSCDRKVFYVERLDISTLVSPKPRTITLDPISKRSRAKHQARKFIDHTDRKSRKTDSGAQSESIQDGRTSTATSSHADSEPPLSPSPTVASFESQMVSSDQGSSSGSLGTASNARTDRSRASTSTISRSITATIQPCAGGVLRGDAIPVKVTVNHTKPIKSLTGVIVTFYRQAHLDMRPSLPIGPIEKGTNVKAEDYYTKSLTGLGGLSLSGADSSHVFRKDLAQVVQPLMVDPSTLNAEVTARVRVPEDSFPTISTVPGDMISFKYYLEVVIDIQGKLGGHDKTMSNLAGLATTTMSNTNLYDGDFSKHAFSPVILDTAAVRRDKGVVTCAFEIIVGTKDSERRKGKKKVEVMPDVQPQEQQASNGARREQQQDGAQDGWDGVGAAQRPFYPQQDYAYDHQYYRPYQWSDAEAEMYNYHGDWDESQHDGSYGDGQSHVPMPQLPEDSQLSEKQRIQQAEMRLLPSQPPGVEEVPTSDDGVGATAPYIAEEAALHYTPTLPSSHEYSISAGPSNSHGASAMADHDPVREDGPDSISAAEASAPTLSELGIELNSSEMSTADTAPIQSRQGESSTATPMQAATEGADPHDSHADALSLTDLPRYER